MFFFSCLTPLQLKQAFKWTLITWNICGTQTSYYFAFTEPLTIWVHRYFEFSVKRLRCDRYRKRCKEGLYSPCLDSPAHCKNAVGRTCDTYENPWKYNYSPAATSKRKEATVSKKRLMIVVLDFFVANEKRLSVWRWTDNSQTHLPALEYAIFLLMDALLTTLVTSSLGTCLWIIAERWLAGRSLHAWLVGANNCQYVFL